MNITKLGHCCMLMEVKGKRLLTDPGAWTVSASDQVRDVDIVLITHEHADHVHVEGLKTILRNNPQAAIVTNTSVGRILDAENIEYQVLEHEQQALVKDIALAGFGDMHAEIYHEQGMVQNTGYMIEHKLFYPGDALTDPGQPVDILALPVAGPWIKIKEAIEYGLTIKPNKAFPVHDGMLAITGPFHTHPEKFLKQAGIEFIVLEIGKQYTL